MMVMVTIMKTHSPPQSWGIWAVQPWIIIVVSISVIIVFWPEIDLFAGKKGIPVIHFTNRLNRLSDQFTCYSDFFTSLIKMRVEILVSEDQEPSLRGNRIHGRPPPPERSLIDLNLTGSAFLLDDVDDFTTPDDPFSLVSIRVLRDLPEGKGKI